MELVALVRRIFTCLRSKTCFIINLKIILKIFIVLAMKTRTCFFELSVTRVTCGRHFQTIVIFMDQSEPVNGGILCPLFEIFIVDESAKVCILILQEYCRVG